MTTIARARPGSPVHSTGRLVVAISVLLAAVALSTGCKSPKKKATEVITDALENCRKADGDFYQVQLMAGSDSTEVLQRTCREDLGDVTVEKGHSATAQIGPYTWSAGIDEATGIWVLKSVSWEPLDQARRRLGREDPGENEIKHAADLLADAQQTYPKSGWIRLKRLDALLRLREKTRSLKSKDGFRLGSEVDNHLQQTLEWADSSGARSTAARARLRVVDFHRSFARQIEDAKGALGSQDEYYKKSIEVAEEKGNEKEAEKYREELEQMRKKRPEKRKLYETLIQKAHVEMCGHLSNLTPDGIDQSDLEERVRSTRQRVDCEKLLAEPREDDKETDGDGGQ